MQNPVHVRETQANDIVELAAGLREQDRAELDAGGHPDHEQAIRLSVSMSDWTLTATVQDRVVCIFGVAPLGSLLDSRGSPWMLGTDLVPQNRRALARLAPHYIRQMLQTYPHLLNTVHARNTLATRWLKRAGFVLREPHDHNGEPFQLFEMHHV